MTDLSPTLSNKLNQGIAAARAGQKAVAQQLLREVLAVAPQTIPAMFWLAFVAPNPYDSVRLLERVLHLDPTNERAQAGLRWARERLRTATPEAKVRPAASPPVVASPPLAASLTPAKQVTPLPKRDKLPARPAPAKARSSRRWWLTGVVALGVMIGLVAWAALWPRPAAAPQPAQAEVAAIEPVAVEQAARNFASQMDTIIMQLPDKAGVEAVVLPDESVASADELGQAQGLPETAAVSTVAEAWVNSVAPSALIGPEIALASTEPEENLLLAHQPAYPGEKWIEVNLTTQQVTAWEGNQPVYNFVVSTGLPNTPTVLGEYNIYWKLEATLMAGPNYYLPEVPYTMYFFRGYGLHGTYWHSNFGQPMSHGCVNLETGNAQTLFEWADPVIPPGQTQVVATADNPGTLVVVHQ